MLCLDGSVVNGTFRDELVGVEAAGEVDVFYQLGTTSPVTVRVPQVYQLLARQGTESGRKKNESRDI